MARTYPATSSQMPDDPTLLGTVQDVSGPTVSVALRSDTVSGLAFVDGHGYRIGQVGSFVRIPIGLVDLFGVVSQVGAGAVPERLAVQEPFGHRWMTVQLAGEGTRHGGFKRGLSQYPTIGDSVHLVTEADLARIYGRPDEPRFLRIGRVASAEGIPALIDVDKLLTRHSAVLGSTGAGKSTTVAGLLLNLCDPGRYPSARVLVMDLHGEYAKALGASARVYRVNPDAKRGELPLHIPYWALTFDELQSVSLGQLDDVGRGALLEKIVALKRAALEVAPRSGVTAEDITVDTPCPFSIHRLWYELHRLVNATHTVSGGQSEATEAIAEDGDGKPMLGDPMKVIPPRYLPQTQAAGATKIYLSNTPLNIRRQLEALASRLRDSRFEFLLRPGPWGTPVSGVPERDLDDLLRGWIGGKEPIAILDLSGIPASVLNDLAAALLRILYESLFRARNLSEGGRERPLLVVLEEAHTYLGQGGAAPAALAVRRIVKEGRKYGVGAMIVSQRPSEIDTTILSQCGTMIAMRLSNTTDRSHVTASVTDSLEGVLSTLPILRTGEAIVVGEAVHLPVRTLIDPPPKGKRPDSSDPLVYDDSGPGGWNRAKEPSYYSDVVAVWRRQDPRSPRAVDADAEGVAMERKPVASSNIAQIGYDRVTQTLEVEFLSGFVYQYFDVPEAVHEALMAAPSKGEFLNTHVKGTYRYARM